MKKAALLVATALLSIGLMVLLGIVVWQSPTRGQTLIAVLSLFLSWPTIVGSLGLAAGITYNEEISGFVKRVSAFKAGGMELTAQQEAPTSMIEDKEKVIVTLSLEQEQELKGQIDQLKKDLSAAKGEKDVVFSKMLGHLEAREKETLEWKFKYLNLFLADVSKSVLFQLYIAPEQVSFLRMNITALLANREYTPVLQALRHYDLIREDVGAVKLTKFGKAFVDYLRSLGLGDPALSSGTARLFTTAPPPAKTV